MFSQGNIEKHTPHITINKRHTFTVKNNGSEATPAATVVDMVPQSHLIEELELEQISGLPDSPVFILFSQPNFSCQQSPIWMNSPDLFKKKKNIFFYFFTETQTEPPGS